MSGWQNDRHQHLGIGTRASRVQLPGRDQEDDRRATLERLEAEHSAALARVATLEREAEALRAESGAAAELAGTAERLTDLEAAAVPARSQLLFML